MRILIVNTHATFVGGVETYLQALLPELSNHGIEIGILIEQPIPQDSASILHGFSFPVWSLVNSDRNHLWKEIERWQPDLAYVHGVADPDLEFQLQQRFICLLFAHNHHGTCISGTKRFAYPKHKPCSVPFGKQCLAYYLPRRCGGLNPRTMLKHYRIQRQRQKVLHGYKAIAVASRFMFAEYLQNGISKDRLHLLPLFPPEQIPDLHPPQSRSIEPHLLYVGRLTDLKGVDFFLKAIPKLRTIWPNRLRITIAGDGPQLSHLQQLAKSLPFPVEFLGWIDSTRRLQWMRAADLLVVPSVWSEPFGLVGIEAGCVGLPAVAYQFGGISDWLLPGETGELAPANPPTPEGLANAIQQALHSPEHWQHLREGAWKMAQRFTKENHVVQLKQLFAKLAHG